jgi:hypothetical protein
MFAYVGNEQQIWSCIRINIDLHDSNGAHADKDVPARLVSDELRNSFRRKAQEPAYGFMYGIQGYGRTVDCRTHPSVIAHGAYGKTM